MDINEEKFFTLLNQKKYESAFGWLYAQYFDALFSYAFGMVQSDKVAEDLVQETFLSVWENKGGLKNIASLESYLYKGVYFNAMNEVRRKKVRETNAKTVLHVLYEDENSESDKGLEAEIRKAIDDLPERCKEIFYLSKYSELKRSAISELLGVSVRTVDAQLNRAINKIRKYLMTTQTFMEKRNA
ncbi:DNA-directed RNA polymerase sigma-70 factor [Fulvitalea axinellae]|uniref:DNA-directed RNA polymerase sigma-70 factor n=1 Tax=Fulvitalea axinellae TaxID=1182444 RepID=A0AAU9D634_9BACT|nr:DNA-directed RNA polymerase sigma-70 factor [Fulvitalea axinellae]